MKNSRKTVKSQLSQAANAAREKDTEQKITKDKYDDKTLIEDGKSDNTQDRSILKITTKKAEPSRTRQTV